VAVVEMQDLTKVYRPFLGGLGVLAVNQLTLDIEQGETFGLVGPNGSGKTTTIKLLLGLLYPNKGRCRLFGKKVFAMSVKERIGYMPEAPYFYDHLTGEQLLHYYASFFAMSKSRRRERVEALLSMVGMQERRKMLLRHYSRGMLQRIGLAQAMINDPELLILDEPTSGLDPIGSYQIRNLIVELKRLNKTIILCSHLLGEVETLCDRVGMLHRGNLLACGTLEELLPEAKEARVSMQVPPEAETELSAMGLSPEREDGLVSVLAPVGQLDPVLDVVRKCGGTLFEVRRSRQTLEEFFVQKVREREVVTP